MFFEGFEGFKKVKNTMQLDINQIFEVLSRYEKEIGSIVNNQNRIIIDIDNKYMIDLYIDGESIIIERRLNEGEVKDSDNSFIDQGKGLSVAQVDRMIEQVYDLLNDYMENNGTISEHITSVKKILYMEEKKRLFLGGVLPLGNLFTIKTEDGKAVYEAKQKHLNKAYILKNLETKREEYAIKYTNSNEGKFVIIKQPFEKLDVYQDKSSVKTILKANELKKELKVSADYTDNHYLIEVNEIVIGAIDCLDPVMKNKYKLEINDIKQEALIVAVGIMTDIYNLENNNEEGLQ